MRFHFQSAPCIRCVRVLTPRIQISVRHLISCFSSVPHQLESKHFCLLGEGKADMYENWTSGSVWCNFRRKGRLRTRKDRRLKTRFCRCCVCCVAPECSFISYCFSRSIWSIQLIYFSCSSPHLRLTPPTKAMRSF